MLYISKLICYYLIYNAIFYIFYQNRINYFNINYEKLIILIWKIKIIILHLWANLLQNSLHSEILIFLSHYVTLQKKIQYKYLHYNKIMFHFLISNFISKIRYIYPRFYIASFHCRVELQPLDFLYIYLQ